MLQTIKYSYSIKALAKNRQLYSLKVCYKSHLSFLKFQQNTSEVVANRIVNASNYRFCRLTLNSFYIGFMRDNFILKNNESKYSFKTKTVSFFINNFKQYIALKDLNRTLLWRALQFGSLFKVQITRKKKNKKIFLNTEVYFIRESHRILLVWTWLKFLIKSFGAKNRGLNLQLQYGLENFLGTSGGNSVVESVKLQIYRIKLLRSL